MFIIDEIHRSNSGTQNIEMISLFDELQSSFDNNKSSQIKAFYTKIDNYFNEDENNTQNEKEDLRSTNDGSLL